MQAVFSALAVVTNIPQLHAKLFGTHPPLQRQSPTDGGVSPDVETSEDNRSLIDILIEIWVEAGGRLASVEDADEKLQWMRQSLGVAAAGGGVRVADFCYMRRLDVATDQSCLFVCHRVALMRIKVWQINSKQVLASSDFSRRLSCWRSLSKNLLLSYRFGVEFAFNCFSVDCLVGHSVGA